MANSNPIKLSGRKPGSINKKTQAFQDTLEKHDFNVAEALLDIYGKAMEAYNSADETENGLAALKLAGDMVKEIACYSLPKLKSIEVIKSNPLEGLTPQEKLDMMKEAVKMLEHQAKEEDAGS